MEDQNHQDHIDRAKNYSAEEIIHCLEGGLFSTDIIMDGYEISEGFSDATAILYAGVCQLRCRLEDAIGWIENSNNINYEEESEL